MISRALNARKRKIFALFFALAASIGLSYALTPKGTDVWDDATKTLTVNSNPQDDYYNDQGEIKRLVISSSVTEIGEQAFSSNYNLQEVIAYDGLQVIDQSAFFSCPNLESVILPSTLREVRYSAFAYCDNLKYVTINAPSLEDYAEYAFDDTHTDLKIYVPAESVATYKTNWSAYADRIEAIGGGSAPATTVVTITNNDFPGMDVSFTKDGVTVSADWIDNMQSGNLVAPGSFSTTLGNFTKIEVNAGEIGSLGEGWSGNSERQTWTGNASSVSFSGDISGLGHGITIMFTIEAAAPAKTTLTLSDKVSILGMPIAGITDLGTNNYEVEPGTEFQIQAAVPEHYNFIGWSDLDSTDPNYSANPRTITINSDLTIKPMYALEAFTITLTSNDTTMGKVTLRAGSGGGEDGDMSIANNADLEGANTSRNIAVGADGSIHVVYKSTEDQSVKYIKSMDGVTFTEPVTVANDARECEVAVSSNGKVYVSYYVENDGGYIAYSADGTSFTSVRVDNNAASIHLATDGDYVYGVNMAGTNFYYSSNGGQTYNMHSGWSGYMFSDVMVDPLNHNVVVIKDMPEVVVRYSTDHGATFTEEAPVMVQGENDQLAIFFSTATMGDGKVYMAGAGAFVAIIDYKTATCTKTDVNSTDNRSLCADPVGNVIVGVEQNENLYYQLSTNSAVSFGDKVLVSNGSGANAALNYHDGTLLYLFTKDNKLYLATRTGIVPTESVVDNGDGTYAVQYGTEVTFTAKAKPGYHVESWSNAVEVNDIIVATQTLEVNSAMTIGATFAANPILTIATNDSTKGIVSLGGAGQGAGQGAEAAEINPDMAPQSWQGDETLITVNDLPGFGSMTEDDALAWGLTSAPAGMCKLIYAVADGGKFKFMDFYDGGYSMDGVSFMDRDRIYSTLSEGIPVYYAIGGEAIEGIIDLGGGQYSVVPGTELTFVAKPAEEHYLVSWNDEPATSDTLKLTMNGELAVNATFAHVPYTITLPEGVSIVAPVPAGITDKGNGVYEIVEGTQFQISADNIPEHYHFDHWADLADSVAMYAANPRTIVAGENLTIEPIFAIDTYTLTLATNDSTKGIVSVIGAGSGAGAGVGEMISLSEKQTENPVLGEYFQVVGEGANYDGRIIGQSNDYQLTISSQNGEKLDFIILKVSSKSLWSGYTVSSTAGDVEDLLDDNYTIRVSNINATSVTISRSGTTANPTGHITVSNVYVNEEIPFRFDITDFEFPNSGNVLTGNGVTLTAGGSFDLATPQIVGGGTFTTDLGNFTKIEIYAMGFSEFSGEGWTEEGDYERIWTGNASSVSFDGAVIGDGMGTIYISYTIALASAAASGIVDNGDGTYTVDWGTELTFVAKPAEGFMLESWSNGAEVTSDTLKLTMTEELSLTANFKHIPATITLPEGVNIVEPMPAGITSKGEGVYEVEYGTEFQISADSIPAHYHFDHWADLADSAAMYAANPRTIVAGENLTIEPIFAIDTYTLTLATNDSTMGTLSVAGIGEEGGLQEPSAQLIVPESWSSEVGVTITAADLPGFVASTEEAVKALPVPTEGSVFVIYNFKDDGGVEAVTFENGEYVRTTSTRVDHANASYYSNQGMIFLYTTAAGQAGQGGEGVDIVWDADSWNGIQAYMNGEDYVHANNSKDGITITFDGGDFENGLKDGKIKLDNSDNKLIFTSTVGKIKKIEIRGYASYKPEGWSRDGGLMWEGTPSDVVELFGQATFVHFVSATFTIEPDATTGKIVDNGDGTYTVDWGTELTFVAKAAEGYHVESWSNGAEVNDLVEATQTITMTEALDLSALFAENPIITLATNDSTMGIVTLAGAGNQLTVAGSNMDVNQNIPIRPVSSTDTRTMNQSIYPAAMLTGIAGDSISGMTYYISEPGAHVLTATYVVKLMETEQAAFSDAVAVNTESATTVYTGTIDVTGNTLDIVFDQPYAYNGGNLLVEFSISSASHQNALAKFSVFASQGGSFQQYYNFGFEEMRYYTYDFLAKTTFICGAGQDIPGVIDLGNGQYNVLPGTELTFVAQPAERFMLESWSNGAPVNGDSLTLTVTDSLNLTANFKYIPAVITLPDGVNIVAPVPAGITDNGDGTYTVEHGTEFQISADGAPEHYHFDHWADLSAEDAQYYANPRTVVADTNFTANPFYTIDTYTLTLASNDTTMGKLTVEPAEGIVKNDDGTYTIDWGTEVTFVAVPAEDYHLLSWGNGAEVTEDNKQTLTITEALSLSAFFKHDTYILTVEGAEVEIAKFADGTTDAVVLNPGTLVGVQEGDSVKLTTTATFSSANVADNLDITLHYAIEVIEDGIYDNEYALAITDSIYPIKGAIIEPMTPDKDATPEEQEAENEEGMEIYAYGYCHGSSYSIAYHLKSGKPDQYKIDFADSRFTDVDWTNLSILGADGVIDVEIPVDLPTGDYSMTVTFRDSRFTFIESNPITVSFHVNLPETYVVALFDNVMAVVDTCECLTDIQWYWRANSTDPWTAIEGATGYYYKMEGGLTGEFFIKAKMNGVDTYTCPQEDLSLYGDTKQAKVSAYPNPVQNITTVTIENSRAWSHTIRIVNLMGNEMMTGSFEGNETTIDMSGYALGNYMISVDGIVVKIIKQ